MVIVYTYTALKQTHTLIKPLQSEPQDQKSVNSLQGIISITQLLQHFKHAAEAYLTFRSYVIIFLSHNISDNVQNVVYLKTLSIKIDWE